MDCWRPSSLTPPHRDKNESNSHVQSVCRGDLLCTGDEAHLYPVPAQATFVGGDSKSWQLVVDLCNALGPVVCVSPSHPSKHRCCRARGVESPAWPLGEVRVGARMRKAGDNRKGDFRVLSC